VAIALILLLLYTTFRSIRLALLVISNLPFALIGGVFALFLSGQYLSVPASVGFVVLFGVAVLNGLVLVSRISQLREEGFELQEAIRKGALDRLRPVLMTASISIFSLMPMLFAGGAGSEIQKPLATVVVGGLVTSTLLTLLIIPSVYYLVPIRKRSFFALAASICGFACAAYRSTPPRNPLTSLPGLRNPRFQIGN
jgi:cobalt-zinc-cadmium resistance protein CzcA